MRTYKILSILQGGDRRSIGRSDEVAALVARKPRLFPELFAGLWSDDPLVRMRAADAAEKVTRTAPKLLQPYKEELLGLLGESDEQEVRWHLAAMAPRLNLTTGEAQRVALHLAAYLEDHSSIVKTFALQGLSELAQQHPTLRPAVLELLREALRSGTAAMRARSRKLLAYLELTRSG